MAINFPTSPTANDTYTIANKTWKYNGYAWDLVTTDLGPFANTANAAFDKANSANVLAYNTGIGANNWSNTKLANTDGVVFGGTLNISKDIYINGNVSHVNTVAFQTDTDTSNSTPGVIGWNVSDNTLNLGLGGDSILQIGQETLYYVINQSGETIHNGNLCMFAGTNGGSGHLKVARADTGNISSQFIMGVATQDITNGSQGFVTHFGKVNHIDSSMWSAGDILYADPTNIGGLSNTSPKAPHQKTIVAAVVTKHAVNGVLFVRPTLGSNLGNDELVELNGLANGDIITYITANGRFENSQVLVSAYNTINAAFGHSNNVYAAVNSAFAVINAAFDSANNVAPQVAPAFDTANAAFNKANSANVLAYNTGIGANAYTNVSTTAANNYAGAMANSSNVFTGTVYTAVNSSFGVINAAFGVANNAYTSTNGTAAFAFANGVATNTSAAFGHSNTTYAAVNSAFAVINAAFGSANTVGGYANTAGSQANQAGVIANAAFGHSNTTYTAVNSAFAVINSAFGKANTALQNTSGSFGGNLTVAGAVNSTSLYSNTYIDFDKLPYNTTLAPYQEGRFWYNNDTKTIQMYTDYTDFNQSYGEREWVRVRNDSGATIPKGKPVYVTGVHIPGHPIHGHHPTVALANAGNISKREVIGLAGHDIPNGSHGFVVCRGYIEGINTAPLATNSRVHLGYVNDGDLIPNAPEYPNYPVDVGLCLTSNTTNGTMYVDIANHSYERLRVDASARFGGDVTIEGDFFVFGNQLVTTTTSSSYGAQFIYMGTEDSIPNANVTFTGTGLNDLDFQGQYTGATSTNFWVKITEANTTGDYFSWSYDNFTTTVASNTLIAYETPQYLSNGISVYFQANTGHTIGAKWNAIGTYVSVDFGIVGNHNDGGSYTHAGMFRDATDGTFKFFNRYDSEPAGSIDIANSTFKFANVQVERITANTIYAGANDLGAIVISAYGVSNGAFGSANTVGGYVNTVGGYANTAGSQANQAGVIANAAFGLTNTTYAAVNSAFGFINAAFGVANNAYTTTNGTAAFAFANGVATNTTAAFGHSNTTYAAVNSAFGVINAAFGRANTSAQLAFYRVTANGSNLDAESNLSVLTISSSNNIVLIANATNDGIQITQSPSGVTATTYGGSTQIPVIVVDAYGRLTSASNVAVNGMDYPYVNTSTAAANTWANTKIAAVTSNGAGRLWANTVIASGIETVYVDLSTSGVTATTYGGATQIPVLAVDAYGRITGASNVAVSGMDYAYVNTSTTAANNYAGTLANGAGSVANNKVSTVAGTSGRITSSGTTAITLDLATAGPGAGSYTGGISALTIDAYGRLTAVTGSAGYFVNGNALSATTGSFSSYIGRSSAAGGWLSGNYASVETTATPGCIYTIGGSYVPTASALNTMYGIGFTYKSGTALPTVAGSSTAAWGLYGCSAGSPKWFLDTDSGHAHLAGNLYFGAANPSITASSYTIFSGGIYVSGGTLYVQGALQARGGLSNDQAAALTIAGGTSGITTFTGTVGMNANILNQTLSDASGTISWDVSAGMIATVTLTSTGRTLANPTNLKVGTYILHVVQDATGSRTITSWGTAYKFPAGVKPTLSTGASQRDVISMVSDGTNLYCAFMPNMA